MSLLTFVGIKISHEKSKNIFKKLKNTDYSYVSLDYIPPERTGWKKNYIHVEFFGQDRTKNQEDGSTAYLFYYRIYFSDGIRLQVVMNGHPLHLYDELINVTNILHVYIPKQEYLRLSVMRPIEQPDKPAKPSLEFLAKFSKQFFTYYIDQIYKTPKLEKDYLDPFGYIPSKGFVREYTLDFINVCREKITGRKYDDEIVNERDINLETYGQFMAGLKENGEIYELFINYDNKLMEDTETYLSELTKDVSYFILYIENKRITKYVELISLDNRRERRIMMKTRFA